MKEGIFSITNSAEFTKKALEIFDFQSSNCEVYKKYLQAVNRPKPTKIDEIPFLPIEFFKKHDIVSRNIKNGDLYFLSSGTGSSFRSKHWVFDLSLYLESCVSSYARFVGDPKNQVILALLPNYIEQGNSGLVKMVEELITISNCELSGFYLENLSEIKTIYNRALSTNRDIVIFGVSYSLMDLADLDDNFKEATIIETGGMKGKRKELTKKELFEYIHSGTRCKRILSEFGMTELFSQAYAGNDFLFLTPPWMEIVISDPSDPFTSIKGKRGVINVIDLANIDTCSFIQTQDVGTKFTHGFTIEGRLKNADIRGCNQLVH